LLRATAIARRQNPVIKLLALSRQRGGELAREQQAIQALVQQLDAAPWARIETGFLSREQLIRTLAACDLVTLPFEIVPSDVPLSVLEAMALGLPVIATDVACLPELVPDGTGFCVPPADVEALVEALLTLAASEEQRLSFGAAARERVRAWQASAQDALQWTWLLEESL
jgi:glycosyltransferase involved in cell wall biosynthesis